MSPPALEEHQDGAVAQLGEHLLCKQGVSGSIPLSSTKVVLGRWIAGHSLKKNKFADELRFGCLFCMTS